MTNDLSGRVAIVTGASRGLGEGIVLELAAKGAQVVAADVLACDETVARANAVGQRTSSSSIGDVTDPSSVDELVASTIADRGRLDILVNNAGIYTYNPIADVPDEEFRRTIEVNLNGVFYGCRAAARVMREQNSGRIINIASQRGKVAMANEGVYAASKAGVVLMTQALALELAGHNVTCNCICPGAMTTPMQTKSFSDMASGEGTTLEAKLQSYISENIPAGRFGTAQDVGKMAAWLASDDASFTTGAALNLTGGQQVFF